MKHIINVFKFFGSLGYAVTGLCAGYLSFVVAKEILAEKLKERKAG